MVSIVQIMTNAYANVCTLPLQQSGSQSWGSMIGSVYDAQAIHPNPDKVSATYAMAPPVCHTASWLLGDSHILSTFVLSLNAYSYQVRVKKGKCQLQVECNMPEALDHVNL